MYQLINNSEGELACIKRLSDGVIIPPDKDNTSYQKYLEWVTEGNTPEPYVALPEPEPLTPEQKLANAGLTVDELRTLLSL